MQIIKGKLKSAKKVVVYGPEGIGKSTFAAQFPDPVFIDTEGSTSAMDVARFEKASSWTMLQEQVRYVMRNPGTCKTLVIDTIDWAEQMCVEDLLARNGKKGIEDFGYGNGYVYAKEEFGRFLNLLSEVVDAGIHVVLTAHAQIRKFEQPDEMGAYDRYELKLGKKTSSQTSPLVKEWADLVLFANYKTYSIATDDKGKKHKAQGGKRVMYTTHHPCWDAKNRYGLPEELPFDYAGIAHVIEDMQAPPAEEPKTEVAPPVKAEPQLQEEAKEADAVAQSWEPAEGEQMNLPLSQTQANTGQKAPPDDFTVDERIPKNLRDLMTLNRVTEWDLENIVEAKGYVPAGTAIWDYDKVNPGIVDGLLVASWDQVYAAIKNMKEKQETPFD